MTKDGTKLVLEECASGHYRRYNRKRFFSMSMVEALTPKHLKDGWILIANNRNKDTLEVWDGHGWTKHLSDGWRAKDEKSLSEEIIRLSSLNEEGQPIFVKTEVVQGDDGKWYVQVVDIFALMRGEELNRGDEPWRA